MVRLVEPIVDLSRTVGGPQRLAPRGEGSLFGEVVGGGEAGLFGGAGGDVLLGGLTGETLPAPGGPVTDAPAVGRPSFLSNPLLLAGITGLAGGNPLDGIRFAQAQKAAAAKAQADRFKLGLLARTAQRKEQEAQREIELRAKQQAAIQRFNQQIQDDPGFDDNQKLAAQFRAEAGDFEGFSDVVKSIRDNVKLMPIVDEEGNTVALEDPRSGKQFASEVAAAREKDEDQALTRRGQNLTAARAPFVRVEMPDGTSFSAQRNDPRVAAAAKQGANVFTQSVQATSPGDLFGSKTVRGQIEGKKLDAINALARVNQIEAGFEPSFLEFGSAIDFSALRIKEKAGGELTPEQSDFVNRFSSFKRDAIGNINATLNELSGAAVSPQEEKRLRGQLPDPGQGIFDGDSPTQFASKMRGLSKDLRRAIVRFNFATRRGENPLDTGIELADVDALIDRRGAEIKTELKKQNPNLSDSVLRQAVLDQLRREFGL